MLVVETLNDIENLLNKKKHSNAQRLLDSLKIIPKSKHDAARFEYLQAYCVFQKIEAQVFIKGKLKTKLDLNDILKTLDNAIRLCQQARLKVKQSNAGQLCKYIDEMQVWILKLQANLGWDYSLFNPDQRYTLDEYKYYRNNALIAQKLFKKCFSFVCTSDLLKQIEKDKTLSDCKNSLRLCEEHISAIEQLIQQSEKSEERPNKKKKTVEKEDGSTAISTVFRVGSSQGTPLISVTSDIPQQKTRTNVNTFEVQYVAIDAAYKDLMANVCPSMLGLNSLFEQCKILRNDTDQHIELTELDNKLYLMQVDIKVFQANSYWNSAITEKRSDQKKMILKQAKKHYEQYYTMVLDLNCPLNEAEKMELKSKKIVDINECVKEIAKIETLIGSDKKENFDLDLIEMDLEERDAVTTLATFKKRKLDFFQSVEEISTNSKSHSKLQMQI